MFWDIQLNTVALSGITGSVQMARRLSPSINRSQIVIRISREYSVGRAGAGCGTGGVLGSTVWVGNFCLSLLKKLAHDRSRCFCGMSNTFREAGRFCSGPPGLVEMP